MPIEKEKDQPIAEVIAADGCASQTSLVGTMLPLLPPAVCAETAR